MDENIIWHSIITCLYFIAFTSAFISMHSTGVLYNSWSSSEPALEISRLMNITLKQTEEGSLGSRTSGNKLLISRYLCKYTVLSQEPQCSPLVLLLWNFLRIFFTFHRAAYCFLKTTRAKTLKTENMNNSIHWCFSVVTCDSPNSV